MEVADLGHVLRVEAVPLPPLGEGPHVDGLEATHAQHLHDPGQEGQAVKAFQCNKKQLRPPPIYGFLEGFQQVCCVCQLVFFHALHEVKTVRYPTSVARGGRLGRRHPPAHSLKRLQKSETVKNSRLFPHTFCAKIYCARPTLPVQCTRRLIPPPEVF